MKFSPNVAQLCKIAELHHARAPVETIARELHITAEDFIAWRQAMMAAAADDAARLQRPEPVPRREPPERHARMTAARLFEMPAPEQGQG
jgi:hypothetical protein